MVEAEDSIRGVASVEASSSYVAQISGHQEVSSKSLAFRFGLLGLGIAIHWFLLAPSVQGGVRICSGNTEQLKSVSCTQSPLGLLFL
jgi:hypothetical protein